MIKNFETARVLASLPSASIVGVIRAFPLERIVLAPERNADARGDAAIVRGKTDAVFIAKACCRNKSAGQQDEKGGFYSADHFML